MYTTCIAEHSGRVGLETGTEKVKEKEEEEAKAEEEVKQEEEERLNALKNLTREEGMGSVLYVL